MSEEFRVTEPLVRSLCAEAIQLLAVAQGPVRRLKLQAGRVSVEIEWPTETSLPAAWPGDGAPTANGKASNRAEPTGISPVRSGVIHAEGGPPPPAEDDGVTLRSPLVGTFYRASEPGTRPFVEVDDVVRPGDQIGIVEAMKLMNPVEAERPGRVRQILVANGAAVEFDQPLIVLSPLDAG